MYDVIVIGAGPAGMCAAIYAASRGLKVMMLEKKNLGGVLGRVSAVTHYPGIVEGETGKTITERMHSQVKAAGVEIRMETAVAASLNEETKLVETNAGRYEAKAVIIAGGTVPRRLDIPGEEQFMDNGVSFDAVKDGANYAGKEVFVVGGSDGAAKEALYLAGIAGHVTMVHFEDKLGAIPEFTNRIEKQGNLDVKLHSRLAELRGDGEVRSVVIEDVHSNERQELEVPGAGIFLYAGSLPDTGIYKGLNLENGFIITDEMSKTNVPGVFAAGDICKKTIRQAATAVADGAAAAISAAAYIKSLN